MSLIEIIRQAILNDNYEITGHAFEEIKEDNVSIIDVENAILYGKIVRELTHDLRGKRYLVEGCGFDKRLVHVVCRMLSSGKLRIITVYAI
jgi:hypothetical protein